ncbi:hypothetical protein [Shouchella hunanensis]|uniref:DUF1292 domain-containing protein n=1 Tax=Shouchella hunanensis TaxID=766894 RepID=A0ABY7W1U3_9BACI|nr:hypothetical protein [Shouchella hunanensis]WDF02011.1 hypothetical protein PQ477_10785 [Shouchella hunanensis]
MITFKKQGDKNILMIEQEEVVVDKVKILEGQFLAIVSYLDEEDNFQEAELFYHLDENEVNEFLESIEEGVQHKYQLSEDLFK